MLRHGLLFFRTTYLGYKIFEALYLLTGRRLLPVTTVLARDMGMDNGMEGGSVRGWVRGWNKTMGEGGGNLRVEGEMAWE